jgi:hypothetical protein
MAPSESAADSEDAIAFARPCCSALARPAEADDSRSSTDAHCLVAPLDNNRQISFVSLAKLSLPLDVSPGASLLTLSFAFQSFVHFDFSGTASLNWRDRRPITEVTDLMEGWDPTLVEAIKTFKSEFRVRTSTELPKRC